MRVCLALHGSYGCCLCSHSWNTLEKELLWGRQMDRQASLRRVGRVRAGRKRQPCKNTQLEAAIREAMVSVKVK